MKNLHDKFVKEQLLDKRNAIDFLKISLPGEVLQYLDLAYLEPTQNSFISEDIKELFSDIVYKCKIKTGDDIFCNILIEHKSYKDPMAAFKIGSYVFRGYLQQIKNKTRFRVIIPLVFYHHEKTWKFKPVESYFEHLPSSLRRFVPMFETIFFDVNTLSDKAILDIRNTAIITMFLTQKHHQNPEELLVKMEKIYESLQTEEERNSFNRNIVYLLLAFKKETHFIELIKKDQHKPIHQVFMTLYEQAISEGMQKGKLEGKIEGKTEVILKGYENGISLTILANITDLTVAEVKQILKKNKRFI